MSETAKHRHQVREYCTGNGVDLGSGGDPVVPWAIQVELPQSDYLRYNPGRPDTPIQWHGSCTELPFKNETLDFLHASHLIEDFRHWSIILKEWDRVLKPGGYMIISVPDHIRFRNAVERGQGDNLNHKHESCLGELPQYLSGGYVTLLDQFVSDNDFEYSIIYVGRKIWRP